MEYTLSKISTLPNSFSLAHMLNTVTENIVYIYGTARLEPTSLDDGRLVISVRVMVAYDRLD